MPAPDTAERTAPRSRRGLRTQGALVAAARTIFERDGYLDARISDISKEAGVSSGSFYTYFDSKEEVFAAVVESVQEDMLHPHVRERLGDDDVPALIDAANREYLHSYKRNARLMALFEQVAQIDGDFRELRRKRGDAFATRNATLIRRLQEEGKADPSIDPRITAHALSAMVGRMAYLVFVLGERIPFEDLVGTLNKLWANALQLRS
ncbi:MAG TPA: TetR/AcrR family transcriptional regulator [Solirubrobacterales bacterium]